MRHCRSRCLGQVERGLFKSRSSKRGIGSDKRGGQKPGRFRTPEGPAGRDFRVGGTGNLESLRNYGVESFEFPTNLARLRLEAVMICRRPQVQGNSRRSETGSPRALTTSQPRWLNGLKESGQVSQVLVLRDHLQLPHWATIMPPARLANRSHFAARTNENFHAT